MTDLYTYKDFEDRTEFYKNGRLHRDGDKPAIIRVDGTQHWFKDGKRHRGGDNPAVIWADGRKEWYRNGEKYTPAPAQDCNPESKSVIIDGKKYKLVPANPEKLKYYDKLSSKLEYTGSLIFRNAKGEIHRDGDKPAAILADGSQYWYRDGERHRDGDKPAIILANGSQYWYKDGKLHRDGDKPAAILANGIQYWYKDGQLHRDGDNPAAIYADGRKEWYRNGEKYTPAPAQDCNPSSKSVIIDGKRYRLVPEE
jgi:hypothetical protein